MFHNGNGSELSVIMSDTNGRDTVTLIMNELKSHITPVFNFWSVDYIFSVALYTSIYQHVGTLKVIKGSYCFW
jgi:hypothetical protein